MQVLDRKIKIPIFSENIKLREVFRVSFVLIFDLFVFVFPSLAS